MVTVRIHLEGGGDSEQLHATCRQAFHEFFEKAGLKTRLPKVVPCGPRNQAFDSFLTAVKNPNRKFVEVLLVDSEGSVASGSDVWSHLKQRDKWDRPDGVADDSAQLMVQCMEAWFLADPKTLTAYFGSGFNVSKLPSTKEIETVAKGQISESLKQATRDTKKGKYEKGDHSFQILAKLKADKVIKASSHAARLIAAIKNLDQVLGR